MTGKQRMLEILDTLPDDAAWEEVLDAVRLDEALEQSLACIDRGEVIPHEEVMRRFGLQPNSQSDSPVVD